VLATDNSIYQRLPQAAVFPLDADDVARVATLMAEPRFHVKLTRAVVALAPTASR
jgi:FAD/FMN-containing dehydrogenase